MQRKRAAVVVLASSMLCTMAALAHSSFAQLSASPLMPHDIVIIKDSNGYRLLHGHPRMTNMLRKAQEVVVDVKGEGSVSIRKSGKGYLVGKDYAQAPLQRI